MLGCHSRLECRCGRRAKANLYALERMQAGSRAVLLAHVEALIDMRATCHHFLSKRGWAWCAPISTYCLIRKALQAKQRAIAKRACHRTVMSTCAL